jgi:hypothetical protein
MWWESFGESRHARQTQNSGAIDTRLTEAVWYGLSSATLNNNGSEFPDIERSFLYVKEEEWKGGWAIINQWPHPRDGCYRETFGALPLMLKRTDRANRHRPASRAQTKTA